MPHRNPLVAARARMAHLRARIAETERGNVSTASAPTSLDEALAEIHRLERALEAAVHGSVTRDAIDELDGVACGDDDVEPAPPASADLRGRRRAYALLGAALLPAVCAAFGPAIEREIHARAEPVMSSGSVRFTGVVLHHSGALEIADGEPCEVVVATAEMGGLACGIEVRCARLFQRFVAPSCPRVAPIRVDVDGFGLDVAAGTAMYTPLDQAGRARGNVALRLDNVAGPGPDPR